MVEGWDVRDGKGACNQGRQGGRSLAKSFGNSKVLMRKPRKESPLFLDVVKQVRLEVHRWVPLAQHKQHARSSLCGSMGAAQVGVSGVWVEGDANTSMDLGGLALVSLFHPQETRFKRHDIHTYPCFDEQASASIDTNGPATH